MVSEEEKKKKLNIWEISSERFPRRRPWFVRECVRRNRERCGRYSPTTATLYRQAKGIPTRLTEKVARRSFTWSITNVWLDNRQVQTVDKNH